MGSIAQPSILITGASGYLGARLAEYFYMHRPEVRLYLSSKSGICPWISKFGTVIPLDLTKNIENQLKDQQFDYVIHLAALNEIECKNSQLVFDVNIKASWELFEYCLSHKASKIIYASTIHSYGPQSGPISESSLSKPKNLYGMSHYMAEQLLEMTIRESSCNGYSLRFSNIVGCPSHIDINRWSLLVPDLCKQAVLTSQMKLKNPNINRDFISMKDACSAIEAILFFPKKTDGYQLMNVASGKNQTVQSIAKMIQGRFHTKFFREIPIIIADQVNALNEDQYEYDPTKIQKLFGWHSEGDFINEIDELIKMLESSN